MVIALDNSPSQDPAGRADADNRTRVLDATGVPVSDALAVVRSEPPLAAVPPVAHIKPWGPLCLAIYNLLLGAGTAVAIGAILLHWAAMPADATSPTTAQAEATVRFLVLTALGAGFGAVLHNLLGLHIHFAVVGDFQPRFSGSYVLGPIAAMGLGFALFVILQGGLLALGGDAVKPDDSLRPALFYIAIGILTGLAWDLIILRFDAIARQLFGGEGNSRVRHALEQVRKPGEPG